VTASDAPLVEIRGMAKAFPGVQALLDIDLDLRAGEVRALVGENGAGKSTLMKIVAGVYRPDGGSVRLAGQPALNESPRQALERGISMIHQELNLAPNLSVAENVFLGRARPAPDPSIGSRKPGTSLFWQSQARNEFVWESQAAACSQARNE
jgi:ABC-type sugar transport system ATPase subunit